MTILFREDWDNHPTAIVDWETSSESAKLYASKLHQIYNITNYDFVLALHNPALQGIDVYSEEVADSIDLQVAILLEIKQNFWYFLREVVRVPGKGGGEANQFRIHRGNMATLWCMMNHISVWYLGPRQITGKSLTVDIAHTWVLLGGSMNSTINLLTKDDVLRATNLNRLKDIRAELPEWMQLRDKADVQNTGELTVSLLNNRFIGHVPANNEIQANNKGRGITSEFTHIDEPPFQKWIATAVAAMLAGGNMARQIAKENGSPYWTVYTTTAGSLQDRDGKDAYELLQRNSLWTEAYFDATRDTIEDNVRKNNREGKLGINATFYYYMLGYTKDDILRMIEDVDATDPIAIAKDFYLEWYRGVGQSVIPQEVLKVMNDHAKEGKIREIDGYNVRWYKKRSKYYNKPLLISLDPSEGIGEDALGIVMVDPYTGETVAAIACYNSNLQQFSLWLFNEFIVPFKKSILLPESRMGRGIIDILIVKMLEAGMNPFKRIFNFAISGDDSQRANVIMRTNDSNINKLEALTNKYRKTFGFPTSGNGVTARSNLYGRVLRDAYTSRKHVIYDKELIDQLSGLQMINNRVDHEPGQHDDLCIPFVLSHWFLTSSRNLAYYGLDSLSILQYIPFFAEDIDQDSTPEEVQEAHKEFKRNKIKHKRNMDYLKELRSLMKKAAKEHNPIVKFSFVSRMIALRGRLDMDTKSVITLDAIEAKIKALDAA